MSDQHSLNLADTHQKSATTTRSRGTSAGASGSETQTTATGTSQGRSVQESQSESNAIAEGEGWSVTKRWVHLASKIREVQETGQFKHGPTAEQLAARQALLMELPPRFAVVKRQGSPAIFIRTRDVPDAFVSPQALAKSIDWIKRMMLQLHEYAFIPDLCPEREDERIRKFLDQGPLLGAARKQRSAAREVDPDDAMTPLDI